MLLLTFALLVSGQSAKSQFIDYQNYALTTKAYYNRLWTADRAEFLDIQKGKNWNLIPSVGLVFGLPSVNLNTGQIANYKERQATTKAKLKSIDLKYELLLNEQLNIVRVECEKVKNEKMKLDVLMSGNETRDKIFDIYQEAFRKHEMKPIDFYREKLAREQAEANVALAIRVYAIQVLELEKLSHFDTPTESIAYDSNAEFEGVRTEADMMNLLPSKLPAGMIDRRLQRNSTVINPLGP